MIEILETKEGVPGGDTVQVKVGQLMIRDGAVVMIGVKPALAQFLHQFRCPIPGDPSTIVGIEDGEPWLKALPASFSNPYTRAAEVPDPPTNAI